MRLKALIKVRVSVVLLSCFLSKVGRWYRRNVSGRCSVPLISLKDDFQINFKVRWDELGGIQSLFGLHANTTSFFALVNGTMMIRFIGGGDHSTTFSPATGVDYVGSLIRVGGVLKLIVGDVEYLTKPGVVGSLSIDTLYSNNGEYYLLACLYDLEIYDSGDSSSGVLQRFYKIDNNSDVIIDYANGQDGLLIGGNDGDFYFE